ncbi:2-succinyl-5-enolpyruvyl-6-hydroxy-3-cyclohexene-1-carboxylic-acid synthase [Marinilongibacter aquaticus]|uniref:2-succinyl-5-enolpyruvyl-6-hydroxy-3- cyclohexene-1-carboxylic-acid synthase n=1 Tax=Marinilongibacter aquaticus TaxID=2975157 RepID=UPI0021BD114C|nr:2-succinyl-5-enolpyruvyl-6-hydroxy-3-cyclohexene-1-carboxylic-acid synthase [Marinilongibacter aquaticus]UBM59549.1 2-succinyl-5-enolpyruvyl-6-hydroxy-3-cyclohexene-1-carboxylic-acid synthase [Marinilongibacter aquaticus]
MIKRFQQLAQLCVDKGIRKVVICPGSRNAALTIAFTAHSELECFSVSDERSAAYFALGLAQESGQIVALTCTSGTAALNFGPAVAEAYFLQIPLLILTADRPAEWINQYDGQTIFQENVYGKHVKKFAQWLPDLSEESNAFAARISNELINLAQIAPCGPVHMNIPIREPFYPDELEPEFSFWRNVKLEQASSRISHNRKEQFVEILRNAPKRILLIGQQFDPDLAQLARRFAQKFGFVLLGDSISNVDSLIRTQDILFKNLPEEEAAFVPDFLLSMGMSIISKPLKLFLRNAQIETHWHIQNGNDLIDPFLSISDQIVSDPKAFFEALLLLEYPYAETKYVSLWQAAEEKWKTHLLEKLSAPHYSHIHFLYRFVQQIPADAVLHLGNSMTVRYVNLLSAFLPNETKIYCNRGTSGIDGSLSTAVGQALATDRTVYCILGDLSFQYDKNAMWNNHLPANLKIIVLNNAGGIIFGMIDGPRKQAAYTDYFKTTQNQTAEFAAHSAGLKYTKITDFAQIETEIRNFQQAADSALLEVFTDSEKDIKEYKELFKLNY